MGNTKKFTEYEKQAIEELSQDLKANKYVNGEMQFTDNTNAIYFLKAYGDRIRYCVSNDKFLLWNGTNWEIDGRNGVESLCKNFIYKMYRGLRFISDPQLKTAFERHLTKSESFRRIQALVGMLKISEEITIITVQKEQCLYNLC